MRHRLCLLIGFATVLLGMFAGVICAQEQGTQEHNNVRPAIKWRRFDYTCENSTKVTVYIHDSYAKVHYQDQLYMMRQTSSADGTRYSDGKVAWWSKGEDGFLQEDSADGDGQKIVKDCYQEKAAPEESTFVTVSGMLSYLARMALPAQAVIHVQLLDITTADAPPTLVAEEKFPLGDRQAPVPFTIKVAAKKIDAQRTYGVTARILVLGQPRFVSKGPTKVLTQGNPSKVDLVLLPAVNAKP